MGLLLRQAVPRHLPLSVRPQANPPTVELRWSSVFPDWAQPPSDRGENKRTCGWAGGNSFSFSWEREAEVLEPTGLSEEKLLSMWILCQQTQLDRHRRNYWVEEISVHECWLLHPLSQAGFLRRRSDMSCFLGNDNTEAVCTTWTCMTWKTNLREPNTSE